MRLEEIKEQVAKEKGFSFFGQISDRLVWSSQFEELEKQHDQVAERYAQSQTQELTDWKESMMKVHSELDLQGIGTALELPLGSSIAPQVLPEIIGLIERNKELVEMLSLVCMDLEERGRAYGDAYTMSKELLTKYNHLKSSTNG